MHLGQRFSTAKPFLPDVRADWLTDRVAALQSALNVVYGNNPSLRTHARWIDPYRAEVSVLETGRMEPRVRVQVTPRSCRLEGIEGTSREIVLRTLQTVMGPDAVRVRGVELRVLRKKCVQSLDAPPSCSIRPRYFCSDDCLSCSGLFGRSGSVSGITGEPISSGVTPSCLMR